MSVTGMTVSEGVAVVEVGALNNKIDVLNIRIWFRAQLQRTGSICRPRPTPPAFNAFICFSKLLINNFFKIKKILYLNLN